MLKLMYITNLPEVAKIADKYGVDRVWVDLEILGKEERQPGNTVKSHHSIDDIKRIKPLLRNAELMVRVNPWNDTSKEEINAVIDAGADIIMLPMWKNCDDVNNFLSVVNGKCKTSLLLETIEAECCIDQVLEIGGFDEIHIGLNDLHLDYGLTFMFELLANGKVEELAQKFKKYGIPFGFGGVGKIGDGMLKADNIVMEHYRLGSSRVILSRAFCNTAEISNLAEIEEIFKNNIRNLRKFEQQIDNSLFEENKIETVKAVEDVVNAIKQRADKGF